LFVVNGRYFPPSCQVHVPFLTVVE